MDVPRLSPLDLEDPGRPQRGRCQETCPVTPSLWPLTSISHQRRRKPTQPGAGPGEREDPGRLQAGPCALRDADAGHTDAQGLADQSGWPARPSAQAGSATARAEMATLTGGQASCSTRPACPHLLSADLPLPRPGARPGRTTRPPCMALRACPRAYPSTSPCCLMMRCDSSLEMRPWNQCWLL